jgi:drug/metabolite transporter (DMT)-like permease
MASLIFLQPIAGTLLGVATGEPLPMVTILGGVLVFAGIYFTHLPNEK